MATSFSSLVKRFARDESGVTMVEYAVMVGLITTLLVAAIAAMSDSITDMFTRIGALIDTANTNAGGTPN